MSKESLKTKKSLNKKTVVSVIFTLILMPLILGLSYVLNERMAGKVYYIGSVLMIVVSMIPFFISFEGRKPQARELVVIAVLCALAVASRVALIMFPHFKPIIAIIIIAGISFGPQAGFFTGALSAFVSQFFFGQGPWTPWQMFAYGIAGFIAGLLAKAGLLDGKKRVPVCIFGALIVMLFVSPILDTSSVLAMSTAVNLKAFAAFFASGLPVNLILTACTVLTLALFSKPMTEKLDRIKLKYGMLEEQA